MAIFEFTTTEDGDRVTLALSGELDLASAGDVEEELSRIEQSRPAQIVLDLRALSFMDSTGLRLIAGADHRAREDGRRVTIVQGPEAVKRVFSITRLDERLEIVEAEPPAATEAG